MGAGPMTEAVATTWQECLVAWSEYLRNPKDKQARTRAADASCAYAAARNVLRAAKSNEAAAARSTATGGSRVKMPFGVQKGTPIMQVTTANLKWAIKKLEEWIADPARAQYAQRNIDLQVTLDDELSSRGRAP